MSHGTERNITKLQWFYVKRNNIGKWLVYGLHSTIIIYSDTKDINKPTLSFLFLFIFELL